jgi:EpsI family protein
VWFCAPTIASLQPAWIDDYNYTHGYLVLILTAFLVVVEIRRAPLDPFVPSWAGFASVLALLLVMTVAHASTTPLIAQLALPAVWMSSVWAATGWRNARRFVAPLAYLYVAIPVWHLSIEPLRVLTILVVSAWIRAAGLPAFIEGNLFHVPSGTFEVQQGCAGFHYALVALALAAFVGLLSHRRVVPAVLLVLFGLALAAVGNWLRVFGTVVVGLSSDQNFLFLFIRDHHLYFGWTLFVLLMVPLLLVDRALESRASAAAAVKFTASSSPPARWRTSAYATCTVLALGVLLNYWIAQESGALGSELTLAGPGVPGWKRVGDWPDAQRPVFVGASTQVAAWYADGEASVGAYVAHYAAQQQGREVVFSQNHPEGQVGAVMARQPITVKAASAAEIPFQESEIADPDASRRLVWVGLRVAGRPTASAVGAKLLQVAGVILGRHDAQALVLTAKCGVDCAQARSWLSRYAEEGAEPLYEQAERSLQDRVPNDSEAKSQ